MQSPSPFEQRNLFIALGLSLAILIGFHFFYDRPRLEAEREKQAAIAAKQISQVPTPAQRAATPPAGEKVVEREAALNDAKRVQIKTPRLQGTLNLRGARFDDLELSDYHVAVNDPSPVTLLSPAQTAEPYFADFSWLSNDAKIKLPDAQSMWQADHETLTPDQPVTLHWDNGQGLRFEQVIKVDDQYLFNVIMRVVNHSQQAVEVYPFGRVRRPYQPALLGTNTFRGQHSLFILHEGPIGYVGNKLYQPSYNDLSDNKAAQQNIEATGNGWLGITDKYWLVALVPDQKDAVTTRIVRDGENPKTGGLIGAKTYNDERNFQTDFRANAQKIGVGESSEYSTSLFAGAKEMAVLDRYEKTGNVPRFDLAVDFGWFYIITKPFFYILSWLAKTVGNFGVAIIMFTLLVRGIMAPVAIKSQRSMQKMKTVQPKLKEIQQKYKADPTQLQQQMMALYKKEGINPASGCLPMLIQIPVFFALYKVLYVTIEMRHAPFIGYLRDLSSPDPTNIFNLFGLIPWTPPQILQIGLLPVIMGITMALQFRMQKKTVTDPTQQQMFAIMPWVMIAVFAHMPAGLVLYWTVSNILALGQQWYISRSAVKAVTV